MKKLDETVLRIGDIILTTGKGPISKGVRATTRSRISHAMLYVDTYSVIDSTGEGVHARNTQRLIYRDHHEITVLRPKKPLTADEREALIRFAREQVGTSYSKWEAARSLRPAGAIRSRRQFCSRLVAQGYRSINRSLVENADFCFPEQLKKSLHLQKVEGATIDVSKEEAALWAKHDDLTEKMRRVTNKVLKAARCLNPSIESLNDIDEHLLRCRRDDRRIAAIFRRSGYLTLGETARARAPWQYDIATMREAASGSPSAIENYCRSLVREAAAPHRFEVNRAGYRERFAATRLETFRLLHELHEQLCRDYFERLSLARDWLIGECLIDPEESLPIRPNGKEWFAGLKLQNPLQASMTRTMLELAGSAEGCSVCGDDPASDYRLENAPPQRIVTLRLCEDCLGIRAGMGERFVPMNGGQGKHAGHHAAGERGRSAAPPAG